MDHSGTVLAAPSRRTIRIDQSDGVSMNDFIEQQNSENTKRAYAYDLQKWVDWVGERDIDRSVAVEFKVFLSETLSSRSAARVFNTVRAYYRFNGGENPFEGIKSPPRVVNAVPKVPEDALIDKMFAICTDKRDLAVMALLANGLRASEVAGLTQDDWNWSYEYNCYLISVIGKGNKHRIVPATEETARYVEDYLQIAFRSHNWLILNKIAKKMTLHQVEYVVESWSKRAGTLIRPHALRHHYATRLHRSGVDQFSLMRLLGHAKIETTNVYVNLNLKDLVRSSNMDPRNVTAGGMRIVSETTSDSRISQLNQVGLPAETGSSRESLQSGA